MDKKTLLNDIGIKFLLKPGPHKEKTIEQIYNGLEGTDALNTNLKNVGYENLSDLLKSSEDFVQCGPATWDFRGRLTQETMEFSQMLAANKNAKIRRFGGGGGRGGGRVGGTTRNTVSHPNVGGFKGPAQRDNYHKRPMATNGSAFRAAPLRPTAPSQPQNAAQRVFDDSAYDARRSLSPRSRRDYSPQHRGQATRVDHHRGAKPTASPPQWRSPSRRNSSPPRGPPHRWDPWPRGMYKDNEYDKYGDFSNDANRSRGGEQFGGHSNNVNQLRRTTSPPTRHPKKVDDRNFKMSRGFFDDSVYDAPLSPPPRSRRDYSPDQRRTANDYRHENAPRFHNQRGFDDEGRRGNHHSRSPPRFNDGRYRRASSRSVSPMNRRQSPLRDQRGGPSARDAADPNRDVPRPLSPKTSVRQSAMNRSIYRHEPLCPTTSGDFGSTSFRSQGLVLSRPEPRRPFDHDSSSRQGPKSASRTSFPEYSQYSDSKSTNAIPPPGILATTANQRSIARAAALAVKTDPSVDPYVQLAAMFKANVDVAEEVAHLNPGRETTLVKNRVAAIPRKMADELQAKQCEQLLNESGSEEMNLIDLFRNFEKRFGQEFPGDNYLSKIKFLLEMQEHFPAILGKLIVDEKRGAAFWGSAPPPRPMDDGELMAVIKTFVHDEIERPQFNVSDVVKNLRRITEAPEHVIARMLTYVLFERNKNKFKYTETRHEEVARLNSARDIRSDYTLHQFNNRLHPMFKNPRRGERVEVEILTYRSTYQFNVRLSEHTSRFVEMMNHIQSVYGDETRFHRRLRQGEYKPDDAVVYCEKDQNGPLRWHRGIIMEGYDHAGRVCVNLVDHGKWSFANASDLLPLLPQFMVHPPFGLPCALYKQRMHESEHWKKSFLGQKYDAVYIMVNGQGDMKKERLLPVDLFLVENGAIVDIATAMENKDGYGTDSCDEF